MPDLMRLIVMERAEALYLYPGAAPALEVKRRLHRLEGMKLTPEGADALLHAVSSADHLSDLESDGMVSFHFHFGDQALFQVVAFRDNGIARLQLRRLDDEPPGTPLRQMKVEC